MFNTVSLVVKCGQLQAENRQLGAKLSVAERRLGEQEEAMREVENALGFAPNTLLKLRSGYPYNQVEKAIKEKLLHITL